MTKSQRSLRPSKAISYHQEGSDDEDWDDEDGDNNDENSNLNVVVPPLLSRKRSGAHIHPASNERSSNRPRVSRGEEEEEEVSTTAGLAVAAAVASNAAATAASAATSTSTSTVAAAVPFPSDDDDDDELSDLKSNYDDEWDVFDEAEDQDDDEEDDDNNTRAEENDDDDRKPAAQASNNSSGRVKRHEAQPRMPEAESLSVYYENKKKPTTATASSATASSATTSPTTEDKGNYSYDLFDYFEHWTHPVSRMGKWLPDGTKSFYNTWDVEKLRARRKELQDANQYMTRVSPMQREGVDWLCDELPNLFLPADTEKGDSLMTYNEDHHLSMKSLMGHPWLASNQGKLHYPNHMRSHRYMFQAFPQFPWTQSLAKALLTFIYLGNLGRQYRGWTREKSLEFMIADGFGPALDAAKKVVQYTFRTDYSEAQQPKQEGLRKPHSGDEVLELIRHFARERKKCHRNPVVYPNRLMLTEKEIQIIDAADGHSTPEKLQRAHAKAEEINWDPAADQKSPKKAYYTKLERLRATFSPALKHVYRLNKVWLANGKKGLPTYMTDAEQRMLRAFMMGNCPSQDQRKQQVDEAADALGWDPTVDKGKPKSVYRTNLEIRADSRDDVQNLFNRHQCCQFHGKKGNKAKLSESSFTESEVQIMYACGVRNGADNSVDGKLARGRAKAEELGWSIEADKDNPRTNAVDVPRRRRIRYMRHVETGQLGKIIKRNNITMDDGSQTQRLNSNWEEIGDYFQLTKAGKKLYLN